MATNNFHSHTGSDGLNLEDRVNATDYDWSKIGENIAAGQRTVTDVMEDWLESEGHCKNIMNDQFEHFGVSRADNEAADFNGIGLRCLALSVEDQTETPTSKPLIKAIRNKALIVTKRGCLMNLNSKRGCLMNLMNLSVMAATVR